MEEPFVSVVIPCYNAEKTLVRTVASVQSDTYSNYELILIDDGSTDGTSRVIKTLEDLNPKIRGFHQLNHGVSATRNFGMRLAKSKYVHFFDADDILMMNALNEMMKVIIEQDEEDLIGVFCPCFSVDLKSTILRSKPMFDFNTPDNRIYFSTSPENNVPTCVIVKKSKLLAVGGFNEKLTNGEDYDLWQRLLRRGGYFKYTKTCAFGYTQHSLSAVHNNLLKHYRQTKSVIEKIYAPDPVNSAEEFIGGYGATLLQFQVARRAFGFAVRAAILGQSDTINALLPDLKTLFLDQLGADQMLNIIKAESLKSLCKPEKEWEEIWPSIQGPIITLVELVNNYNHNKSFSLRELKSNLFSLAETTANLQAAPLSLLAQSQSEADQLLNIIYLPGFETFEDFVDQYYRLLWYLNPIKEDIQQVYIPCARHFLEKKLPLPGYFDPAISLLAKNFSGKIYPFPDNDQTLWNLVLSNAKIILNWKLDVFSRDQVIATLQQKALQTRMVYRIDNKKFRYEGSLYLKVSHDTNRNYQNDLRNSNEKFLDLATVLSGGKRRGYIFGTGPSLGEWKNVDFSDGEPLAINSMVKNIPLMDALQPKVIIFGDPIFHGGPSTYAAEFRKSLFRALDAYHSYLVIPFRDYKLYMENLPAKYQDRIIGIPLDNLPKVNLNLMDKFVVKTTSNIMTLLLLPIATTFFDEIGMMGFDGRKVEDNKYFWGHHKESQFNEQMGPIQHAHPSFFSINYDDYYSTHLATVEEWLSAGEQSGKTFYNLVDSYIPALQKRRAAMPVMADPCPA